MPPIPVTPDDARAIAEYIHSVAATMRGREIRPPGAPVVLNVLVGDAAARSGVFQREVRTCHSVTGDLQRHRLADVRIQWRCRTTGCQPGGWAWVAAAGPWQRL